MAIYSFEPIVDKDCRILLLGTMPGVMSLKKQQYYGYDRNAFWRILYALFDKTPDESYEMRKEFLLQHNIAVWDVLKACEREGSSDSDIRDPVPNDFNWLYNQFPKIKSVCFNGGPAGKLYKRFIEKRGDNAFIKAYFNLPSTSPAYTIAFERKLEQWRLILMLLQ